ncbi:MAG: ACP S-malonyltransferase [Sulfurifustaceae bacterium]
MKLAFVFPGQGSQSVGMLGALAAEYPQVRATFAEASAALGYDLWSLAAEGPEEKLALTEITQPLMLTAGVAVWRTWCAFGGATPILMAGHSLGEYTALVCAGAFDFSEAVRLVADRARYMQEAVPPGQGGMAAVLGLSDDAVRNVCAEAAQGEVLEPVNFNSPAQVVIAGTAGAVARAMERAKAAGAKRAVTLAMSIPAHSSLMAPAADRLAARLQSVTVRAPIIPVIHNADVGTAATPEAIRRILVRQIASPVRWVEIIQKMAVEGVRAVVECGPGKVLTGLNKRIARDVQCFAVEDPAALKDVAAAVKAMGEGQ